MDEELEFRERSLGAGGDVDLVRNQAQFALRSLSRHAWLVLLLAVVALVGASAAHQILPRQYRVYARVLVQPAEVLPSLAHPDRRVPRHAYDGTRGAIEMIKSRPNLEAMIDALNLEAVARRHRPAIARAMQEIRVCLDREPTAAERRDDLIERLDEGLWATLEDNVVVITANWNDAETAKLIADAALQRFLDYRRDTELGEVRETIAILEESAAEAAEKVEQAASRVEDLATSEGFTVSRTNQSTTVASPALRELRKDLARQRGALERLESAHAAAVDAAKTQLSTHLTTLEPAHPDVLRARRHLREASAPSAEIRAMREEVRRLQAEASRMESATKAPRLVVHKRRPSGRSSGARVERALQAYENVEGAHYELLERLEGARLELHTARAGFGYRYIVTLPALTPRDSESAPLALVLIAALLFGLVFGWVLAIWLDLRRGVFLELWQVESKLALPVLAHIERP